MSATPKDLDASLTKLSLNPQPSKSSSAFRKKQPVADSWEDADEEENSGSDTDRPISPQTSADYPSAPPPTPISPSNSYREDFVSPYGYGGDGVRGDARSERLSARPEKTDAVAKRMIAGALGVRAPKKTEEQRAYDRAIKEKEAKRRNAEKESAARAKEEAERAKAAIWED